MEHITLNTEFYNYVSRQDDLDSTAQNINAPVFPSKLLGLLKDQLGIEKFIEINKQISNQDFSHVPSLEISNMRELPVKVRVAYINAIKDKVVKNDDIQSLSLLFKSLESQIDNKEKTIDSLFFLLSHMQDLDHLILDKADNLLRRFPSSRGEDLIKIISKKPDFDQMIYQSLAKLNYFGYNSIIESFAVQTIIKFDYPLLAKQNKAKTLDVENTFDLIKQYYDKKLPEDSFSYSSFPYPKITASFENQEKMQEWKKEFYVLLEFFKSVSFKPQGFESKDLGKIIFNQNLKSNLPEKTQSLKVKI